MRIRYQQPQGKPSPRTDWLRFRVNANERAHVESLAKRAGVKVSNYLRALVALPALSPGAPVGNQNRKGTRLSSPLEIGCSANGEGPEPAK